MSTVSSMSAVRLSANSHKRDWVEAKSVRVRVEAKSVQVRVQAKSVQVRVMTRKW